MPRPIPEIFEEVRRAMPSALGPMTRRQFVRMIAGEILAREENNIPLPPDGALNRFKSALEIEGYPASPQSLRIAIAHVKDVCIRATIDQLFRRHGLRPEPRFRLGR